MTEQEMTNIITAWFGRLWQLSTLIEIVTVAVLVLLAWGISRHLGRRHPGNGIWYGSRGVDGVVFPVLLTVGVGIAARVHLQAGQPLFFYNLAVPLVLGLLVIRVTVRVLLASFPGSAWVNWAERTLSWGVWVLLLLWLTHILPGILHLMEDITWTMGGTQVSVRNVFDAVVSTLLIMLVVMWLSSAIESRLLRSSSNLSVRKMAANALRSVLIFVGILLAMSAAGIPLTALSVLGGAVGVGIGLGFQKLAANYVSGFVILAEQSVRIGDHVRVDNFEGRITNINTRYTVLRTPGGIESIVPNEMMVTNRIENISFTDSRVALNTRVSVGYETDLDALFPQLVELVRAVPRVLADPGPSVMLIGFGADGLDLQVNFWIGDPDNGQGNVRSDVNLALWRFLTRNGIEIPYPQRVVHHTGSVPAASEPTPPVAD
ncbi:mechanosensitive ion channel family protein [Amphibiibacter pelophylacis]|uniref:Mechanosensitive ion channel n=1 Tax=Amphibiibacter pelophylacis TaxID=1799477 RepID=A0ACC6P4H2_9BURK